MSEIDYDSKVESLQEETEQLQVWATEYYLEGEMVRRDVRVDIKKGFEALGEAGENNG